MNKITHKTRVAHIVSFPTSRVIMVSTWWPALTFTFNLQAILGTALCPWYLHRCVLGEQRQLNSRQLGSVANKEKSCNFDLWPDLDLIWDLFKQNNCVQQIDIVESFRIPFPRTSTTNGSEVSQGPESSPPTPPPVTGCGLTRALEGAYYAPHLFFANTLKTAARSAAKFDIPAHNSWTHLVFKFWLPRSKGQVTRSGQSQMCTSGPASNFNFALWAQLYFEWFETLRMRYWRRC